MTEDPHWPRVSDWLLCVDLVEMCQLSAAAGPALRGLDVADP